MSNTTETERTPFLSSPRQQSPVRWIEDDFTCFEPPRINYEPSRWATARTKNVEEIAKCWSEDDALVYVFKDSKLRGNDLVMLRKQLLDVIVTPLFELCRGRAAIQVDIDMFAANVRAMKHSLRSLASCLDPGDETTTEAAQAAIEIVNVLEVQIFKMSASVVVSSPKDTEVAVMTEEEEALAEELLAEEEMVHD